MPKNTNNSINAWKLNSFVIKSTRMHMQIASVMKPYLLINTFSIAFFKNLLLRRTRIMLSFCENENNKFIFNYLPAVALSLCPAVYTCLQELQIS